MALEILHLSKTYGTQAALTDISLTVGPNEIIGLLGPNGAGKSTLMKSITGILKVQEGEIRYGGQDVTNHPLSFKQKIGFLPENNPLYTEMYVREFLRFAADLRKVNPQMIPEIITLTGLETEQHKKIHQLSKGYKQRVGLAAALLHHPELLILDEPTNGLDPNQIVEMREVIRKAGAGKSVILSTHIMQEVEALCTRVVLIDKGRIIRDASIESFKDRYRSLEEAFQAYTHVAWG